VGDSNIDLNFVARGGLGTPRGGVWGGLGGGPGGVRGGSGDQISTKSGVLAFFDLSWSLGGSKNRK
jgi:hypothetical protein